VTLELSEELARGSLSVSVEGLHHLHTALADFVGHLNFTEETDSDGLQGILGPLREPVNGSAVDKGGEVSHSVSERVTDR